MNRKTENELEQIRRNNLDYTILDCFGPDFSHYGKIITEYDVEPLIKTAQTIDLPPEGVQYDAGIAQLEEVPVFKEIVKSIYKEEIGQAGLCYGFNNRLNALEYHKSSEVLIAVTSCVLVLGRTSRINNYTYNTSDTEIFYVPEGTITELYHTTLHFAPIQASKNGFSAIIILPKGTNLDFADGGPTTDADEDRMLFKQNKWIIASSGSRQEANGAHTGLTGEPVTLNV